MGDQIELLTCPFCGGAAHIRDDSSHSTAVYFGCDTTGCPGHYLWEENEADAIRVWNTRATTPAQAAQVLLEHWFGQGRENPDLAKEIETWWKRGVSHDRALFYILHATSAELLNGCIRILVDPTVDKDGKPVDGKWFDQEQIEVLQRGKVARKPSMPRKRTRQSGFPG